VVRQGGYDDMVGNAAWRWQHEYIVVIFITIIEFWCNIWSDKIKSIN
jgi:hypothetical protein